MKDVIVGLDGKTPLQDIEEVLQDLDWIKYNDNHPKRKWDYSGVSPTTDGKKIIVTINEKRKTEKDAERTIEFFHFRPFPKMAYDEYTFQASYDKTKTGKQRDDILAERVGLKRRPVGYAKEVHIGKKSLTPLEREKIKQRLNSFGVPFPKVRTVLNDGILNVFFFESIPDDWKKMIPNLVDIWLHEEDFKKGIEVNFDYDIINKQELYDKYLYPLTKKFGMENIQIRRSANPKNHHARIINKLFKPKESLRIRERFGDSPSRILADRKLLKKKLKCNFLYEVKYSKPARRWVVLEDWIRENKIVI